jgi:hypothetical protein
MRTAGSFRSSPKAGARDQREEVVEQGMGEIHRERPLRRRVQAEEDIDLVGLQIEH